MPDLPVEGQRYIVDFNAFGRELQKHMNVADYMFPIFPYNAMPYISAVPDTAPIFLVLPYGSCAEEYKACLKANPNVVVVVPSQHQNRLGEQRALVHELMAEGIENFVFGTVYKTLQQEKADLQLEAAADMGAMMMDGLTDGLWLMNDGDIAMQDLTDTAYAILQAGRLRMVKTEYISCPGCGRTLYDLRTTIARVKGSHQEHEGFENWHHGMYRQRAGRDGRRRLWLCRGWRGTHRPLSWQGMRGAWYSRSRSRGAPSPAYQGRPRTRTEEITSERTFFEIETDSSDNTVATLSTCVIG